jgi:glycosyltransferase involved in cell wall biosynthesis
MHVVPEDGFGGVEAAARAMAARTDIACEFRLLLISGKCLVPELPNVVETGHTSLLSLGAHRAALKQIQAFKPDVLLCSLWKSIPVALKAKQMDSAIRLVAFLHTETKGHLLDQFLHRLLARRSTETWGDSDATLAARMSTRDREHARIISFVLEEREPLGPPQQPQPVFVSWGRMIHEKGVDRAIHLIAELVKRGVDAHYHAWGPDNGAQAGLERLVEKLGLVQRVHFKGALPTSKIREAAVGASFYLQLSRCEGMAMAVVEGMQFGLVPVVTARGQMAVYCRPGSNGVVVDPDHLDIAADELVKLLADTARYQGMRERAVAEWKDAPLYPDVVCAAAKRLT